MPINNNNDFCPSCGCDPCDCGWGTENIKRRKNGANVHRKLYHSNNNNSCYCEANGTFDGKKTGKSRKAFKKDR